MMPSVPDPLVSAEWLRAAIDAPDLRVIEATWFAPWVSPERIAREEYVSGHIPNAAFFDIDEIAARDTDLPHMLPPPEMFSSRLRRMGIGDGHRVVVYDRNRFMASARVWWTLRVMGHREVFVLDGGLAAWTAAGGELDDLPPMPSERHHTVRVQSHLVRARDQVLAASRSGSAQILDARPAARFTGDAPEPRPGLRQGHIPGSLNLPSDAILDGDRMKSPEALAALFTQAGVSTGQPVICTCGSGVTAAILALGLARMGIDTASVYDGSWAQWGGDPDLPVATGPAAQA